nr:hypothetical protein [Candidatus Sigynarchaeota archaeon]
MKRTTIYLSIILSVMFFVVMFRPVSAVINFKKDLLPNQFHIEYYEYSNNTDTDAARNAQTHLVLYKEGEAISFIAEKNCSLFLLNETEMLHFVGGQPFISKHIWANITLVELAISYQLLTVDYEVETYLFNKTGEKPAQIATMYFAVRNEVNDTNYISLRVGYKNELLAFIDDFFRVVVFFTFFYFGMKLLFDARQARKENQASKTHMFKNYGIGFLFGGFTTGIWEVYHWYTRLDPSEVWIQPLAFEQMPDVPIFSKNLLSFVTFVALGFSILFMSNTVEKMVQGKKIPFFTYILLVAELLVISCIFIPVILLYVVYIWIGTLALAAVNVIITYIKVSRITTGQLKKQALSILISLIVMYLSISLVRIYVQPEFIGNISCTIFTICLYSSLKLAREIRKQEAVATSS